MAADTLGSYGSLARFTDLRRIISAGDRVLVAAGGEISDFQFIQDELEKLDVANARAEDGKALSPSEVFNYLTTIMYNRRNKFKPLWNSLVIAGEEDGKLYVCAMNAGAWAGLPTSHYAACHSYHTQPHAMSSTAIPQGSWHS